MLLPAPPAPEQGETGDGVGQTRKHPDVVVARDSQHRDARFGEPLDALPEIGEGLEEVVVLVDHVAGEEEGVDVAVQRALHEPPPRSRRIEVVGVVGQRVGQTRGPPPEMDVGRAQEPHTPHHACSRRSGSGGAGAGLHPLPALERPERVVRRRRAAQRNGEARPLRRPPRRVR